MPVPLVIPGLRPDLVGVDLVVGVCWPTIRSHLSPHATSDSLGVCTVQPADGSAWSFPVTCDAGQEPLWDALRVHYMARTRFRAVSQ